MGSWALNLRPVADLLGVASVEGFHTKCPRIGAEMDKAEEALRQAGGNGGRPVEWLRYLQDSMPKQQAVFAKELSTNLHKEVLGFLGDADAADVQSHGGTGASTFLLPTVDGVKPMPDKHFAVSLRDRLVLPVCREGDRCQHRRKVDGRLCGAYLDARGHHARKCGLGGGLDRRHNGIRDWAATASAASFGSPALTEQRVPQWDVVDGRTGELEQAVLDVVVTDPGNGVSLYVDAVVKCAHTDDPGRLRARARKAGRAAAEAAMDKRRRYAQAGANLIPLAFEDGGRPSEEAVAFVRRLGAARTEAEEGSLEWGGTARLWQEVSTILQLGNADLVLSANGR